MRRPVNDDVLVTDPAAGMERMTELTRRLISVPKSALDKIREKELAAKKKGKKRV